MERPARALVHLRRHAPFHYMYKTIWNKTCMQWCHLSCTHVCLNTVIFIAFTNSSTLNVKSGFGLGVQLLRWLMTAFAVNGLWNWPYSSISKKISHSLYIWIASFHYQAERFSSQGCWTMGLFFTFFVTIHLDAFSYFKINATILNAFNWFSYC